MGPQSGLRDVGEIPLCGMIVGVASFENNLYDADTLAKTLDSAHDS